MPNWCENVLTVISINQEQLQDFIEKVRDPDNNTELSFSKLLPCPTELEDFDLFPGKRDEFIMKYGYKDCYSWRIANWGTKWDVDVTIKDIFNYGAFYFFESAWSPPIQWIVNVALMFPDLHFKLKYEEPGMGFMGVFKASGESTFDKFFDYSKEPTKSNGETPTA